MCKPLISVIIPVYNVEKYLHRCVDSVLNQTYRNLEIILVNDGSPDNCGSICDEYARNDSRVKVIHKQNGGLSSARNAGLSVSTGKYVTFVDSDDWLASDIYEECIKIFDKEKCDVVNFQLCFSDGKNVIKKAQYPNIYESHLDDNILLDYLYRGQTDNTPFSVCRKVYKRDLFDSIEFPVGRINEDITTNFKVLSKAHKLVHIGNIGYFYFQNQDSISNGPLKNTYKDVIIAGEELCFLANETGNEEIIKLAQNRVSRNNFSFLARAATGGISPEIENPKQLIKTFTTALRKDYMALMKSPMPLNRKVLITLFCINYHCVALPISILKKIKS